MEPRRRRRDALHERIKVVERRLLVDVVGPDWPATAARVDGTKGEVLVSTPEQDTPDPPRAGQRLRQDRPGRAGPRPARGRRRARLDRLDGRPDRRRRRPGHAGRGADRLPGVPRRPGQDAAPARARGLLADLRPGRPRRAARRARHRAVRPGRGQPLPVHRDRGVRRQRRTSASSRSTSAARRWCARPRRTTPASRSSSTRRGTRDVLAAVRGRRLRPRPSGKRLAARGVRAHRRVRRRGRVLVRQRRTRRRRRRLASRDFAGRAPGTRGGAALRREPAPAGRAVRRLRHAGGLAQRRAAARQGDVVQQLRRRRRRAAGPRTTSPSPAVAIIKHANPCGIAVGARRRRGAPQGARLRPGVRVRRRDRRRTGR